MGTESIRWEGLTEECRYAYGILIEPIREVARVCGYAIGVHGSLARDIDLIAVPWGEHAIEAVPLIEAIRMKIDQLMGWAIYEPRRTSWTDAMWQWKMEGEPGRKPHGRKSWVIHIPNGVYLDIAVMPRTEDFFEDVVCSFCS